MRERTGVDPRAIADDILTSPEPLVLRGMVAHWPAVRAALESAQAGSAYLLSLIHICFDGKGPNPVYTEAYGQLDINASYKLTERFTVHAEVINANDGVQRLHGRSKEQVLYVTQTGPRYMFGANYKF